MYCATLLVGAAVAVFSHLPDRATAWALRIGLIIALVGLSVGFLMVVPTAAQLADPGSGTYGSHSVGGDDASGGIPFLGWNTVPRRPPRVPLRGNARSAGTTPPPRARPAATMREQTRLRVVVTAGAAYAAATSITLWQALRGQSVLDPDLLTIEVVGIVALLIGSASVIIRHRNS